MSTPLPGFRPIHSGKVRHAMLQRLLELIEAAPPPTNGIARAITAYRMDEDPS